MTAAERLAPTLIDSGADYIVATVQRDEGRWLECQNNWLDLIHDARLESGLVEDAGLLGYAGLLAGKVFWGTRWDGSLLRITGGAATDYWARWSRATGKPTRLDMQATVRYGDGWTSRLQEAVEGAKEANQKLGAKRQRKVIVTTDNRDGQTVYIGSRKSKGFGRIYHKWAVDADRYQYGDVRYEVEVHGDEAVLMYESFQQSGLTIQDYARGYVWDWFARRGVVMPDMRVEEVNSRFTDVLEQNPLDAKLNWLYNQVGPSVRLLSDQGHIAPVMRVLFGPQWIEYVLGRLTEGEDDAD